MYFPSKHISIDTHSNTHTVEHVHVPMYALCTMHYAPYFRTCANFLSAFSVFNIVIFQIIYFLFLFINTATQLQRKSKTSTTVMMLMPRHRPIRPPTLEKMSKMRYCGS